MPSRWEIRAFQSGTHIVERLGEREPHYYVYAAPGKTRHQTCEELRDWLNGDAEHPEWAASMIPTDSGETAHFPAVSEYGAVLCIQATGPSVESRPGRGDWTNDPAFSKQRRGLISRLIGGPDAS